MELTLDDDQLAVREVFGRCIGNTSTAERVRACEDTGYDVELWRELMAMGAASMAVPENAGGGGAGLLDVALVCEEQGRHLAQVPLVEATVANRTLARVGAQGPLHRAIDGEELVAVALRASHDGLASLVPAGAIASIVIGLDDDSLVAVGPADVMPRRPATMGAAPIADRTLRGPNAGSRLELCVGDAATDAHRVAVREWKVLTAASLVGVGQGALDLGVAYAKDRVQFGVAIGSFQTLAHRLADLATMVDGARLLAYEAAWAADQGASDAAGLASMAFLFAADTAQQVAATCLHVHGGYGFMLEFDIQLYFRRAKAWALVGGSPGDEYLTLASELFGPSICR